MSNEIVDLKLSGLGNGTSQPSQPDIDIQDIPDGSFRYDALHESDINSLSSDSRPTLITLFGISECGKTTFVGSLFAILRRRPKLLKKTFIDSDTLTGFERRVHQRFLSEDGQSIIKKTTRKVGSILNVILGNEQGEDSHMFIISDLSGEIYNDAISDITIVQQQNTVKYADKLVIFVDLEPILSSTSYNLYKGNFQSLLSRFKDSNMLPVEAEIYVALNKIDLVESRADEVSKTEDGEIDQTKRQAFLATINKRKKTIVEIVRDCVSVPDDNILEINSLGIKAEAENSKLIELFSKLLSKKKQKSLPESYNWLHGLSNY